MMSIAVGDLWWVETDSTGLRHVSIIAISDQANVVTIRAGSRYRFDGSGWVEVDTSDHKVRDITFIECTHMVELPEKGTSTWIERSK